MRENGWLVQAVSDVMRTVFIGVAYLLVAGQWVFAARISQGEQCEIGGKRALLSKIDSLPIVDNEFSKRFHWDSFDNPKLTELREKYHFDDVVAPGKDEFDKQLLLLDWVNHRFKKFGKPSSPARGALDILKAI